MLWEVPSEMCAQSGAVEISISIYDIENEHIVFSWNTAKYSGLTVANSMDSVGCDFPAKNEILIIDRETRSISAPTGYNNIICNYGEVGVTEIYFLVNRHLGKKKELDVLSEDTNVSIYITMNDNFGRDNSTDRITKKIYTNTAAEYKDSLVLITWKVPEGITAGSNGPCGLSIMLSFEKNKVVEGKKVIEYKWNSNTYNSLSVGESLYQFQEGSGSWGLTEEYINSQIENFLENNNFIISDE